jgi:hypothetical protein
MISDPHPAVSRMLARMVVGLGYEPVVVGVFPTGAHPTPAQLRSVDALLIEPASPGALALVHTARAANPALAIVGEGAALGEVAGATLAPAGILGEGVCSREGDVARPGETITDAQAKVWRQNAAPIAHLAKPFTIEQLDVVLQQGFAHRDSLSPASAISVAGGHDMRHAA